jgi:hypothetical protein
MKATFLRKRDRSIIGALLYLLPTIFGIELNNLPEATRHQPWIQGNKPEMIGRFSAATRLKQIDYVPDFRISSHQDIRILGTTCRDLGSRSVSALFDFEVNTVDSPRPNFFDFDIIFS